MKRAIAASDCCKHSRLTSAAAAAAAAAAAVAFPAVSIATAASHQHVLEVA
jgi:hypothetical protein